ncbi:Uma2 family endonuclease [Streptomyces olivoreticuli]
MTEQSIYRHLRDFAEAFTPPRPFSPKIEISDGQIVMMMSPRPRHQLAAARITQQLALQLAPGLLAAESTDTEDAALGTFRVPDVLVIHEDAMDTDDPLDPHEILLAIEIVSPSNPKNDYEGKVRDYPAMGIPHYLIIDPRDGSCVHHWSVTTHNGKPEYDARVPYAFGDKITVGAWIIDTSVLPRYSTKDMQQ